MQEKCKKMQILGGEMDKKMKKSAAQDEQRKGERTIRLPCKRKMWVVNSKEIPIFYRRL